MSVVEIKNISKKYRIMRQKERYGTLRDTLINITKNPFRFFKNTILGNNTREEFWALKNINLDIKKGEAIGIIGANGAGKSTFLKIISRITFPTTGEIKIRGRVASLLEIGTGFHPELTGYENIFLNGAIMGMTKKEIKAKLNDIIKFAGIEKFIDTPVKRYSSGMYIRLAFSVAAHMEPDILIVDEVLAVGDVSFQKKCLGKMNEVAKKQGRTVLFVSHNMAAIQNLCERCILLENGMIKKRGKTDEIISYYLSQTNGNTTIGEYKHSKNDFLANDFVELISVKLTDQNGDISADFGSTEDIYMLIEYKIKKELSTLVIDADIKNEDGLTIFHSTDNDDGKLAGEKRVPGTYISRCQIPKSLLNTGKYFVGVGGGIPKIEQFFHAKNILSFNLRSTGGPTSVDSPRSGVVCPELKWETTLKMI
ncbi:MAG TPA: ABC transporter ATP-binding protein [Candidatus Paceibacterota bacterium]|nr:ABC transporter ATP-binding protein [Candidatus Paceibacterota bacterium]